MPVMSSPLLRILAPVCPVNWPGLFFDAAQLDISCCASYNSFSAAFKRQFCISKSNNARNKTGTPLQVDEDF